VSERPRLADLLAGGEYLSYAYSYPHKTTYRALEPAVDLRSLWAEERRDALFLYLHVPFCEQRCGFCNLFTQVQPREERTSRYLDALAAQADVMSEVLGPEARFARLAIGGGTPTYLDAQSLERLFAIATRLTRGALPSSVEASPSTLDADKIAILRAHEVTRVSMGVQSVLPSETSAVQRRQHVADVELSLGALSEAIPVRNVDLIYGLPGQTAATLVESIERVVGFGANEIYLYPLYVRPLTILGRRGPVETDRLTLYRAGRQRLLELGFRQCSMRMFTADPDAGDSGPAYRCQDDGMLGLGPGARSYTRAIHYASPFAVGQHAIRDRIGAWIEQPRDAYRFATHGIRLGHEEQRRRYLILSLLDRGLVRESYAERFGEDVLATFPELHEAIDCGLVTLDATELRLTALGVERADVLGHWLQSDAVIRAREEWVAA
jgi:oxygen-independent coproporphyrinogen-3 oxidase